MYTMMNQDLIRPRFKSIVIGLKCKIFKFKFFQIKNYEIIKIKKE